MRLHIETLRRACVIGLATLAVLVTGCPNSPLADLLAGKTDTTDDPTPPAATLPKPSILSAALTQGVVRVQWTVSAELADQVFGYTVFRSEQADSGFVAQRSFARFEELTYLDGAIRGGTTYFYYVVSVDRLGNLSDPSDTVSIDTPVSPGQVIAYADRKVGTITTGRGVLDLNAAEGDLLSLAARADSVGVRWWGSSAVRWDPGTALSTPDMSAREFFTGQTLADAADPSFYQWTYLDSVILNAQAVGAVPIIAIDSMPRTLALNSQTQLRAPIWTWSDNLRNSPPADPAVFAEVFKRVVMHYTQGWAGGRTLTLPYWEVWHTPDIDATFGAAAGISWTGTPEELSAMYVAVHNAVKAQFGSAIKLGGAGFANPASIGPFLDRLTTAGVKPDFISFAVSNDAPTEVGRVAQIVREALNARALTQVETIASGFNLALPLPAVSADSAFVVADGKFNTVLHAIHLLASYRFFVDSSITLSLHEGLRDRATGFNPGLLARSGADKPASVIAHALKRFDVDRNRVQTAPSDALAMGGLSDDNTRFTLFLTNAAASTVTSSLEIRNLPWAETETFNWSLQVLTDDTFAANAGFGGALGGSVRGRAITLQPAMPPASILQLTLTLQPAAPAN